MRESSVREDKFLFLFSSLLFSIYVVSTVGICRAKKEKFIHSTRATREYQKHGISPRIQVRSSENPKFRYFLRSTAF